MVFYYCLTDARLPLGRELAAFRSNSATDNDVNSWASTWWRPLDNHLPTAVPVSASRQLPSRNIETNQTRLPAGGAARRSVPGTATKSSSFGPNGSRLTPVFSQCSFKVFGLNEAEFCFQL